MNTTIRKLKYSDRRKLSAMIKKLSEKFNDNSLLQLIQSDPNKREKKEIENDNDDNSRFIKLGINLFNTLIQFLEDDITEWFSDLIGVDVETYMNDAPFDIEIIIINQLTADGGEFKSFLSGASKLYKSIKISLTKSIEQKEVSGSI